MSVRFDPSARPQGPVRTVYFCRLLAGAIGTGGGAGRSPGRGCSFPPVHRASEQGAGTGLLTQLIDALNLSQPRYRFVLVPTSIQRRFGDLLQGRTDMAVFENPQWGWAQVPHEAVDMGLEDAEVFVGRTSSLADPHYVDDLQGKGMESGRAQG